MSYQISYGVTKELDARGKKGWIFALVGAVILGTAIRLLNVDITFLLPGDVAVTGPALDGLLDEISGGGNAIAAFGEFCREVIHGAVAF